MATPAKRPTAKRAASRKPGSGLPEDHTESEAVAHAIAIEYNDLVPSVNRIMSSDLGEPGRLRAITLFRASLGVPGEPYRDPAKAIEAGRLVDAEAQA
jgi:hypothetical protein